MRLFLASEVKHPECFKKLEEYVNGLSGKRIAYIPTAANGEFYGSWRNGGSWNLVNSIGADVTLVILEEKTNDEIKRLLGNQDIIWFAGGSVGYLGYWIIRKGVDEYLPKLLDEGALYVGSSAGSMITSKTLELAEWYIGEEERGSSLIPGLGLIDFEIYPHYEESLLPQIKSKFKGKDLYLLKNGEAILIEDNNIKVFGEERTIKN